MGALLNALALAGAHGHGRQGLHLDPGAVGGAGGGDNLDGIIFQGQLAADMLEGQRVAEGDERGGEFRGHDARRRAVSSTGPLGMAPPRMAEAIARPTLTRAAAVASCREACLAETSTMRVEPSGATWLASGADLVLAAVMATLEPCASVSTSTHVI